MDVPPQTVEASPRGITPEDVAGLLGGRRTLEDQVSGRLHAHDMLVRGLPSGALRYLIGSFLVLHKTSSLERAVGISLRTFQRHKDAPERRLSPEQSGRTWKLAEIIARATGVFGSRREAEEWLERPAMGLDQRCPIDLLATPAGIQLVEEFLKRLEYGVYV